MRAISILALIVVVFIAAGCDRAAPAKSSAAPAATTPAAAPSAPMVTKASAPEVKSLATVMVSGRMLSVPVTTSDGDAEVAACFAEGSGVLEDRIGERILVLAKEGKATFLSAPTVAVRSGERAAVKVGQTGTPGLLGSSKRSLELALLPTVREGGIIDLKVDAKLVELNNGAEVVLADWGMPIGTRAKGTATHQMAPGQTVYIARQVGDHWYVWLARPQVLDEPAAKPGP